MEGTLLLSLYWFTSGVLFVLFIKKCLKFRQNTVRYFLGLLLALSLAICLFVGSAICLKYYFS